MRPYRVINCHVECVYCGLRGDDRRGIRVHRGHRLHIRVIHPVRPPRIPKYMQAAADGKEAKAH